MLRTANWNLPSAARSMLRAAPLRQRILGMVGICLASIEALNQLAPIPGR